MNPPPASVILPVKNCLPWLDEALRSISDQTYGDFEVLAVDDGSSDGSRGELEGWSRVDTRVRVLETAPGSRGIVSALELGREQARGTVLIRMDADDVAPPGRFAAQMALLESDTDITACGTPIERIPRAGLTDGALAYERWLNGLATPEELHRDLYVECPIAHPTLAVRSEAVERVGGYRPGPFPEDYDLVLRLVAAGGRLARAEADPLQWRSRADSLQRTDPRYSLDAFRRLKVEHLLSGPLLEERPIVIWGAGPTGKAFAKLLIASGRAVRTFVDLDPRKIGQVIHGAPVVAPDALGAPRGRVALAAVSGPGPRAEVRAALDGLGWAESEQYFALA